MRALAKFELAWAAAEMGAIFPGGDGVAGIEAMDLRGYLVEVVARVPWKAALGLRLAIWVVALAPPFVLRRFATIAGLATADRERVVARLIASPSYGLRSLVLILKTIGALLYAGDDAVRARMLSAAPERSLVSLHRRGHAA